MTIVLCWPHTGIQTTHLSTASQTIPLRWPDAELDVKLRKFSFTRGDLNVDTSNASFRPVEPHLSVWYFRTGQLGYKAMCNYMLQPDKVLCSSIYSDVLTFSFPVMHEVKEMS